MTDLTHFVRVLCANLEATGVLALADWLDDHDPAPEPGNVPLVVWDSLCPGSTLDERFVERRDRAEIETALATAVADVLRATVAGEKRP